MSEMTLTIAGTPVRVHRSFLVNLLGGWAALSLNAGRGHPERPMLTRLGIGAASIALIMAADVSHALAHSFSARRVGAPMDTIEVSANMPRTVYDRNDVAPRAHRGRAIGGPIFSALGLLTGLVAHGMTQRSSAQRELANWWSIGNGLIFFGSLTPTPSVDGGSLLKWHLVESGVDEQAAERTVRRAGLATGGVLIAAGIALAAARRRLLALVSGVWGVLTIVDSLGLARRQLRDRGFSDTSLPAT